MKNTISKETFIIISNNVDRLEEQLDQIKGLANNIKLQLDDIKEFLENAEIEDDIKDDHGWTKSERLVNRCDFLLDIN